MSKLFDCDMHPMANGIEDFLPYIPYESWRERFQAKEFTMSGRAMDRYYHPAGTTLRQDAVPPGGGLPGSDPEFTKVDYLDRMDVDVALMLPIQGSAVSSWTDPVAADVFSTASNDYFLDKWASFDSRMKMAITVSPLDPEASAREIRRHKDNPAVIGVFMSLVNILMGNRHYYPIYEAAVECGMPIVVHPTGAEGCYLGAPVLSGGVPRGYAERRTLFPQVAWSGLTSMVFEGVFQRYKDLKIVFAEFGFSWVPPLMWRLDKEWAAFRIEVPWLEVPPSEFVLDNVFFTTQPMDEPKDLSKLWEIMEMMNGERSLLFSSDYPHWDIDEPDYVLKRIPEHMRQAVAYGNAARVFAERL